MTPEQRVLRSRLGAAEKWARVDDRSAEMAPVRQAWEDSWERKADPDGVLSPDVRRQKAAQLKKAHYLRMALNSAKSRAKKKARGQKRRAS